VTQQLELIDRACPVCGSQDRSHVLAEANFDPARLGRFSFASRKLPEYMHYRLVVCPVCELVYASPAPTPESLVRSYDEAGYDSAGEALLAARTYESVLRPVLDRLPDRDGAIDIGAGDGAFLERLLGLGFTSVVGFEPSGAAIAEAGAEARSLIRHEPFSPEGLEPGRYSLVTCFQTIEHLDDPLAACRQVHGPLKEGGALVLVCHNRRALSARVLGRRSPIFDVEHLQLFSRESVRFLLAQAGFGAVETSAVVNRYELRYWTKLAPFPAALKPRLLRALDRTGLGRIVIPLRAGNLAATGFKLDSGGAGVRPPEPKRAQSRQPRLAPGTPGRAAGSADTRTTTTR
jgi:SAM-dependent methyltransferase